MKGIFSSFKELSINKDNTSQKSETAPAPAVDGFKFEFPLDKKKKKKKKKKSGAKATVGGENDDGDEEEEDGEMAPSPTDESFSEFNNTIVKDVTKLLDDDVELSKKFDADTTVLKSQSQPNSTNTKKKSKSAAKQATQTPVTASSTTIAGTEKSTSTSTNSSASNKKKGKSNTSTSKNNKNNVASIDEDDFDLLISQMNELNKKDLQNAPPPKKNTTVTKGVKSSGGSNKPAAAPVKDTNPRFLSPKDPELDEQTKMKAKYGNGKNLVAIGPQKVRDPNWNTKNTTVTNNIASSSCSAESGIGSSPASDEITHSSVFSFSFGGL